MHRRVIEPFAGAAGYSTRVAWDRDVILIERDPKIAALWRWLISKKTTRETIMALPLWDYDKHADVADLGVCTEAQYLIGFWLNKGSAQPYRKPSSWMKKGVTIGRHRSYWGSECRETIADQVECIKHWTLIEGDWTFASGDGSPTTWFVDPPYATEGKSYRCSSADINFGALGASMLAVAASPGQQVIVCEHAGAKWMPFRPFRAIKASSGKQKADAVSYEVIWTNTEVQHANAA